MASASEGKTTAKRYQEYDEEVDIALLGKEESGKNNFLNGLQKFLHSKSGNPKLNIKEFPFVSKLPELQASIKDCHEEYDLFLLFTTSYFPDKYELKVLEIIKSFEKKVFVVFSKMEERARIVDVCGMKKLFSSTLYERVRIHIPEYKEEDIFLISNKYPEITEWDFETLIRAILDALPLCIVRRLTPLAAPLLHCDDVDNYAKRKPLHELCKLFEKNIPAWSEAEVNIAIIGDAGTGKSSYINAIRGFDDDAEGAAKVDYSCGDATKAPKHFTYPDNPNIRLWDIQGLGSTKSRNDVENYAKNTGLKSYDCFLIFFDTHLSHNAVQLARTLQNLEKPFFFVFTKADTITENRKGSVEISGSEELDKARAYLSKQLKDLGFGNRQLFLISNRHPNDYDFEKLRQAILDALPESKRGTLTLSLQACYSSILKKKSEILRGNVNADAADAATKCRYTPIPGWLLGGYVSDVDMVKKHVEEYRSQFGLHEEGKKYLDEYIMGTKATVKSATLAFPMADARDEDTRRFLHQCLNNLKKEAEEYLKNFVEKATSKVVLKKYTGIH